MTSSETIVPPALKPTATVFGQTLSVLIVDDDEGMRRSLRRLLLLDGYHVEMVASSRELRAKTNLDRFFAILLDRRLPDADGSELLEELKQLAPLASILIVTGYADMDSTIRAIRNGVHDYLIKPVEPETLRSRLTTLAEFYRVRRELERSERRMVQAERLAAIGQMVTGLAHESRNALQRARACLDLLELDLQDAPEQLDLTARIRRALFDLQRHYEEVRNYAAPIVLEPVPCALPQLLRQSFEDLRCEFHDRVHQLSIEDQTAGLTLRADTHRLAQVFRNIFDNAIAASLDNCEIEAQLTLTEIDGQNYYHVEIRDHGCGIPSDALPQLFDPFFTTKPTGTGLGMAICKRIVEAHGGSIEAENAENGSGAIVRLVLPARPPQDR